MKSPPFTNVNQLGSGRLGGAGVGGKNKKTGPVSGTEQLGIQTGGAGHNLDIPGGDALILAMISPLWLVLKTVCDYLLL